MKTGEGKTLVATLPSYLNAISNKKVHIVTVNDYLAKRDALWMGEIFNFLGLSVGYLQNQSSYKLTTDQNNKWVFFPSYYCHTWNRKTFNSFFQFPYHFGNAKIAYFSLHMSSIWCIWTILISKKALILLV